MYRTLRVGMVSVLVASGLALLGPAPQALAVSCSGTGCNDKDPGPTGCNNDAITVETANVKDNDGDNKFEDLVTVLSDFKGVHGITIRDNYMYLANNTQVRRYPVKPDGRFNNSLAIPPAKPLVSRS